MEAFHSTWTAPYFSLGQEGPFQVDDFDLLVTILSALEWRRHNGSIRMVTDEAGAAYYRALGLEHIWDGGLEPFRVLPQSRGIDTFLLWAAGKLFALDQQRAPCVMIDTDFIVWESLEAELSQARVAVIHREGLDPAVYPSPRVFQLRDGYRLDDAWDLDQEACNTALCYLADDAFKRDYTRSAIGFMEHLAGGSDRITGMVFAEQRMLALCAAKAGIPIHSLARLDGLRPGGQTRFTHIWGYKDVLRRDIGQRRAFCRRCVERIVRDFPGEEGTLRRIPAYQDYFSK